MKNIFKYLLFSPVYLYLMVWTFGNNTKLLTTVNGVVLIVFFVLYVIFSIRNRASQN